MYSVARRPSQLVQKSRSRAGLSKNLESPETPRCQIVPEVQESTKIVFQPMKMKNPRLASEREEAGCEALSPEHRELVTWVHRGWSSVKTEMEREDTKVKYYQEKSNPQLADFSPFDLDAWWGRRLYQNLTNGL